MGLLAANGLPVKEAARIAHFGLAVRLRDRERAGPRGGPLPPNFFCMPFSVLPSTRTPQPAGVMMALTRTLPAPYIWSS